ncbi:Copia protein [Termitomyces sp. J132]|nr:Copia protein [Termitomyces sp. J132]
MFGLSSTKWGAQEAKKELAKVYEVKDLAISLSQRAYLTRVLERFQMTNCNPRHTPLPTGIVLQLLGALMWAQAATRPDLSFAVALLACFQANPGPAHWKALLHVLAYIKGTLDYKIVYSKELGGSIKPTGYVDSDYGGDLDTRRSTTGYVFLMAGGPVSWSSKRQQTVALSTTEAEYMAMMQGSQQALWMHNFLAEIDLAQPRPALLHVDINSSIALAQSTKGHARAKHIDIRHHYIRERVSEGDIEIIHIPSSENIADICTKPLTRAAHDYLVGSMGLKNQDGRTSQGEC